VETTVPDTFCFVLVNNLFWGGKGSKERIWMQNFHQVLGRDNSLVTH